ncbi:hypothetical protein IMCC21224_1680, partial [Puniceibacterium sp. IMCC21224]
MRARARLFLLLRLWPALGNMTRRKPWGLGACYGENSNPVQPRVPRGGAQLCVAEQYLDDPHVDIGCQQVGREAVAQRV